MKTASCHRHPPPGRATWRFPADFELRRGEDALTIYTFETGVARHPFCVHCGIAAFYVPRSQPDKITVNARCLDDIDGPSLTPPRFFDGQQWEEAQRKRIADGGHVSAAGVQGAATLQTILDRAPASACWVEISNAAPSGSLCGLAIFRPGTEFGTRLSCGLRRTPADRDGYSAALL